MIDLFNLASKLAKDNESDFVFKYFMRRMLMTILDKKHWDTWQNVLFSAAFSEFGNLRELYEQLDLYQRIGYRINRRGLRNLLETKAASELKGGVSSELSWIIFGFLKFSIKPNVNLLEAVMMKGDDISRILAIKIAMDGGMNIRRKIKELSNLLDGESAISEHWLLFWELYVNDWIRDNTLKSEVLAENIFQFLDSRRVTFLREPAVDLLEVPRPFRERIQQKKGKGELQDLLQGIEFTFHDLSEEEEPLASDVDESTDSISDEEEAIY